MQGLFGSAITSRISLLPPCPTMAISRFPNASFAASTAPMALSSLIPTIRIFLADLFDLRKFATAVFEISRSPPPSRLWIALSRHCL